jgi:hypothetical protein
VVCVQISEVVDVGVTEIVRLVPPTATAQVANHRLKKPSIISFRLAKLRIVRIIVWPYLHLHNRDSVSRHDVAPIARRLDIRYQSDLDIY